MGRRKRWLVTAVAGALALYGGFAPRTARAADNYDTFRFDLGFVAPYGYGLETYGFGVALEPKFYLSDRFTLGPRLEAAGQTGSNLSGSGMNESVSSSATASVAFLAKSEYFLTNSNVRPFVGFGAGFYFIGAENVSAVGNMAGISQEAGRFFGIAPQVGIDLWRVRLSVIWEVLLGADIEVRQQVGTLTQSAAFSRNYLTFEFAIRFGGERKLPGTAALGPAGPPPPP
jgi:hypothetical protein